MKVFSLPFLEISERYMLLRSLLQQHNFIYFTLHFTHGDLSSEVAASDHCCDDNLLRILCQGTWGGLWNFQRMNSAPFYTPSIERDLRLDLHRYRKFPSCDLPHIRTVFKYLSGLMMSDQDCCMVGRYYSANSGVDTIGTCHLT